MRLIPAEPSRLVSAAPPGLVGVQFFADGFLDPGQGAQFHGCGPGDETVRGLCHLQGAICGENGSERKAHRAQQERVFPILELLGGNPRVLTVNERPNSHKTSPFP